MLSNQTTVESIEDIERKSIDSYGLLGSFYDGHRDEIIKRHFVSSKMQSLKSSQLPYCAIEKGTMKENLNLLQFIGIQDELRLNLLLNLTKRVGIAAVLNYSRRINEYTRFLYYSWITRQEQVTMTEEQVQQSMNTLNSQMNATHIISGIDFGIEFVAVFQLPDEIDIIRQIDDILHKIRHRLVNDNDYTLGLTSDEEITLEKFINITTYSNISSLMNITRVSDIFYSIDRMKTNVNHCHPLTYYLQPIEWFNLSTNITFNAIHTELNEQIEQYILQFRILITYLEISLNEHMPKYLYGHLQDRIYNARQQYSSLKDIYIKTISRLTELIIAVRNGQLDTTVIYQELNSYQQNNILKNNIDQLLKDVLDLENEVQINDNLRKQQFNYVNISEEHTNENDMTINTDSIAQVDIQQDELVDINATIDVVPEKNSIVEKPSLPVSDEIINILLLGETGVGKSTFINAFVNYLSFDRLEQVESNKAVVIIPVSFPMTIGDNSEEQTIEFTDCIHSNNEDFDHPGQCVTQHCKSYIFHLHDGCKLCIIDTPGFGDRRGIEQDDFNLQHTFEYIHNLTHINAICFFLKSNTSKLNIFFQSYFTQLFDFLGSNLSANLIFCFTNARSTFFTPGDTTPLLKSMFESLPMKDIPLTKDNTFCFDNESFRYLIARHNRIPFSDNDKHEYDISWSTSAQECNRFIEYIRTRLTTHYLQDGWQSIKHAQFQIGHLIRPLLETIRNTLRNITLWNIESPNQSIELRSMVIHRPIYLCLTCHSKIIQIGNFGIIADSPHEIHSKCRTCQCSSNKHISMEYLLDYKLLNRPSKTQISELKEQLSILRDASAEFTYFLLNITRSTKENRFLVNLTRMIEQEMNICRRLQTNYLNKQLVKELTQWKQKYEEKIHEITSKQEYNDLIFIYKWIEKMKQIPMINEQLITIKKGQEIMMKQHEYQPIQI